MPTDLETAIRLTLDRMDSTAFVRGANDCDAIMADYVLMLAGRDPMAAWRDAYHDDEGALAFIAAAGGNAALVGQGMASIGIAPRAEGEVRRGDVVIVDFRGDEVTGLYLDPFTAAKGRRGRVMTRRPVMKAWPPCA